MEVHAAADMEDECLRVRLLPAISQGRSELKAGVAGHKTIKEQGIDALRLGIGSDARIEICRTAFNKEDNCAGVWLRAVAAGEREQGGKREERDDA